MPNNFRRLKQHSLTSKYLSILRRTLGLMLCIILLGLVGCGNSAQSVKNLSGSWPSSLAVQFSPSISYEQALRLVTNLGLQPAIDCKIGSDMFTPESQFPPLQQWQPVGQRGSYQLLHRLLVDLALPPGNWFARLKAAPGVRSMEFPDPSAYYCPKVIYGTPSPDIAIPLSASHSETYTRISFAHPLNNYDAALYVISNLGLMLVDPCYEQASLQGNQNLAWHPMGQEQVFAHTQTLIVATHATVTSDHWQKQLQAISGVVSIESPYTAYC